VGTYLQVSNRRDDPNYYLPWFELGITAISKDGNDYTLIVLDVDGYDDHQVFTSERQIRITRLDGNEYEVKVLSSNASEYLRFLNRKRFRKEETLTDFKPTHFVARADFFEMVDEFDYLYENEDSTSTSSRIMIGALVELVDSTNTINDKQRVKIRQIDYYRRQMSYAWIDGSKLERF